MKKRLGLFLFLFLTASLAVSACKPKVPQPESLIQTPALSSSQTSELSPTETPNPEPVEIHGELLISDDFEKNSPFCQAEPETRSFIANCLENTLVINQSDGRRKADILMMRELPVELESFSLEVETHSAASEKAKSDQNNYGLYFIDEGGQVHALRLTAQYFNFETWSKDGGEIKVEEKTNLAFSPWIKSAGQSNTLRLDCSPAGCDFFANGALAGRFTPGITGTTKIVGLFAWSNWDEQFGKVGFKKLRVYEFNSDQNNTQSYSKKDALTNKSEVFAGTGLSGAFNKYDADGFHFSPVIPFGYYGVKGGPVLGNMSVGVTIKMEIAPGASSSRYAGLVCRSSLEGMVMAVIRADGTYSIYRDTPKQPFALLAQKASDVILPGIAENKLRLDCVGDQINFYINGAQVESLTDTRYGLRFGRAGLFTKAGSTPDPDAVVFSDFSITEIR
jgi:hypothetical protein